MGILAAFRTPHIRQNVHKSAGQRLYVYVCVFVIFIWLVQLGFTFCAPGILDSWIRGLMDSWRWNEARKFKLAATPHMASLFSCVCVCVCACIWNYAYATLHHILTTSLPCLIRSLRVCHSGCLFLIGSSCLPLCLCPSLSLFHPPHLWGRPVHQSTALWPPFSDASAII